MAQGVTKLKSNPNTKKANNAHKASKNASVTKKGKMAIPPKKKNEVELKTNMKKLSSSINNNIEKEMVGKASSGPLHILKDKDAKGKNSYLHTMDTAVKEIFQEYNPTGWLPNGHFQTIFSTLLDTSNIDSVDYHRHTLLLRDGGNISLDIHNPGKQKVAVICHGLTGGSHESYVRTVVAQLGEDVTSIVVIARGCANTTITSPLLFSAGQTNDLRTAILYIKNLYPDVDLIAIGFSLGANIITKYCAEEGDKCPFKAAVVLSNPWDLYKGTKELEGSYLGLYFYDRAMASSMMALLNLHGHALKETHAEELALINSLKWPTVKQFEDIITCKVGGHPPDFPIPNAEAYCIWASSANYIEKIKIPFLGLNSEDDPIAFKAAWPEPADEYKTSPSNLYKCKANPLVHIYHTKHGGHMAWFEGGHPFSVFRTGPTYSDNYPAPRRWFAKPVAQLVGHLFTDNFAPAPGASEKPVRVFDGDMEWETRDPNLKEFVAYSVLTKGDEIIHGGDESKNNVSQGF
ncbi:hypothetical protein E3P89_03925 [Wallemia ichthyophaga]|nr:hypothetical protein E3P91_03993 [Wallemia ichthyophaga]TIA78756.1 hypothetical protein E3P98_03670 [Wallemia ichthyophaga]TIA87394.1 hypothetical protein E3P97_03965 [Wallemia ichthyophaga]TIA94903.1 hypothetical protein E3P96_03982 [Wallemia ichthyophaga]TIB07231.1 hypothetical protein E3P93_03935 [Wallemia ichthyophaga]